MKKLYRLMTVMLLVVITGCSSSAPLPALSSAKTITAFSLNGVAGTIDEAAKTIAVSMPYGTDITTLVATFTTTGVSVKVDSTIQVSGTTANDFTSPVAYKVKAANTSTQIYTVTVTIAGGDYTSPNIGLLKYVPAGSFQRDDTAANVSTISTAFRMSTKEITRAQFLAVTGTDPSYTPYSSGINDPVQTVNWYHALVFCNKLSILEGLTPVYSIIGSTNPTDWGAVPTGDYNATWDAAVADWSANGYRLPTEMEWMWAAMGATSGFGYTSGIYTTGYTRNFAGSTGSNDVGDYAWTWENSSVNLTSQPVGTKMANELGLFDLSGNVWEWCWDWYADNGVGKNYAITGTVADYRGAASGTSRVIRGGSWLDGASIATVAFRGIDYPYVQNGGVGFRVVRP